MKNKNLKYFLMTVPFMLLSVATWAAAGTEEQGSDPYFYDRFLAYGLFLFGGLAILGAVLALFQLLNIMVKVQQIRIYQENGLTEYLDEMKKPTESFWKKQYKRWTNVVPVAQEQDIMLDHDYDGIHELDNSLPPWWVALFYITIFFAVVYMTYYHFSGMGASSAQAYEMEMEQAEAAVADYLSRQANLVDETNATILEGESDLAMGETIFQTSCATCHGMLGEGGIGPNFTDEYWIHGGDIKDIFKTIKYGVPEKGMISWKSQLSAGDMHKVASYITTLVGTDPPNQKEAQGELYTPEEVPAAEANPQDSTQNQTLGMNEE
ncbi:MAG: cbb3-type cytochrome c oxidase N-terminal domain-containing protein [Bacteroidota bacterium]